MNDKQSIFAIITNPYTQQSYEKEIIISEYSLNDVLNKINNEFPIAENTGVSLWDNDLNLFIYCGNYPLNSYVTLPQVNHTVMDY
jgi:hypothetical protein